ncbi:ABC transporter ATP-binding protein [Slackia isoflavoniconvertens]|uniref:ABC transporter n=1 Tax=Slackia isoflavoniconvertens TaxID=572010 RepID=A0A3N0IA42_9ACTN|nr:ABC transporter ATP-binding protein [Slackia isoflavoniconvertens]MBB3279989.1 ABC-2 type transport system ATP-binding protein [Slackia isoflavoniconvertens]RNM33778.1 ABC transporter [Slackia isoflavoniconvertens]
MPEVVNTSALTVEDETAEIEDNRPVMIDVDHVSMSFNMASEQLNNLKEYAIAIARGKLFFEEFKALDDVSFKVRKGDVFGIMGTNGSGKSTILKIIAGVLEPTKGKCTVNGNIAPLIELGAGFDMDLSARENIYLNGALLGYSKQFIDEHFQEIVEFAEVEKFLDMPLKNYSSGMVARIAFAIATVIVPEILVVDEVLSVGDFMFQKKCEDRITQLIEEYGVTVLIVSHSNDQIARLCNKAIWIEKGHTRLIGPAELVASIYGGLGGRTGTGQSESIVFEALEKMICGKGGVDDRSVVLGTESSEGTCAKVVLASLGGQSNIESLALATDRTHVNAIVATGFAGAKKIPVVASGGSDSLSDSAYRIILDYKPRKIFLFDCGSSQDGLITELESLYWKPEVISFGKLLSVRDFSLEVYSYGLRQGIWGKEIAFIGLEENTLSIALLPLLFRLGIPVFVSAENESCVEAAKNIKALESSPRCFIVGETVLEEYKCEFQEELLGVDVIYFGGDQNRALVDIASYAFDIEDGECDVCIATSNIVQWPELISCGCMSRIKICPLLLIDQTSLDSEASFLSLLDKYRGRVSKVYFINGKTGLDDGTRGLFSNYLFS